MSDESGNRSGGSPATAPHRTDPRAATSHPTGPRATTSHPTGSRATTSHPTGSRDVAALFSRGRLTAIPRKAARREQLLVHLAETLFERDRPYSEPEVNEALRTVHDDCPSLRRYLVGAGLLTRTTDGRTYRRTG